MLIDNGRGMPRAGPAGPVAATVARSIREFLGALHGPVAGPMPGIMAGDWFGQCLSMLFLGHFQNYLQDFISPFSLKSLLLPGTFHVFHALSRPPPSPPVNIRDLPSKNTYHRRQPIHLSPLPPSSWPSCRGAEHIVIPSLPHPSTNHGRQPSSQEEEDRSCIWAHKEGDSAIRHCRHRPRPRYRSTCRRGTHQQPHNIHLSRSGLHLISAIRHRCHQ